MMRIGQVECRVRPLCLDDISEPHPIIVADKPTIGEIIYFSEPPDFHPELKNTAWKIKGVVHEVIEGSGSSKTILFVESIKSPL